MKIRILLSFVIFSIVLEVINGQEIDKYVDDYYYFTGEKTSRSTEFANVEGSPYLNDKFIEGFVYGIDSTYTKLPVRYNLYSNEMEYQLKGINYVFTNTRVISKIRIGESIFVYLPFMQKAGFYELLISGNCSLAARMWVKYFPEESLPITGYKQARFMRQSDQFYIIVSNSQFAEIKNMQSVLDVLQNQRPKIESFIKQEKIKNIKKENLIKIVNYYNSL